MIFPDVDRHWALWRRQSSAYTSLQSLGRGPPSRGLGPVLRLVLWPLSINTGPIRVQASDDSPLFPAQPARCCSSTSTSIVPKNSTLHLLQDNQQH